MSLDLCSNNYGYLVPLDKVLEAKELELLEVVQLLLDKGTDPTLTNEDGLSALEIAENAELSRLVDALRNAADS